ncbi:pilus biosynthesis protein CpaE [Marmoricola endophyticus]|uniref:Pilus biosynthesis protein CpaE n=1 Tax=Marmoricola endophyticus TaxID=2040280 RepID=A0A917BUC2_9ACTN|nr:hypothetical protein [Marmoricola endophyticus]GGF56628.1 pilus biosynthesis protein CpaE [Marmoricola endophyticus]
MGVLDGERPTVLLAAAGAGWEPAALAVLASASVVVVKRCVDLADLLASASAGQADVAVVAAETPGLDASAVTDLLRHDVRTVAVGEEGRVALSRIGVVELVPATDLAHLPDAVESAGRRDLVCDPEPEPDVPELPGDDAVPGRVVVVWGPTGGPGRTTVALGLAAERAHRGVGPGRRAVRVVLADLDPYGGSLAQHLGAVDEVSGVLAAARFANLGELDERRFTGARRQVSPGLELLSGLPRADRWVEVREGVTADIVTAAARIGDVVADTGFCLEDLDTELGRAGGGRNRMTLEALAVADEVVVVGAADPVGLSRLARGLHELGEAVPGTPVRVVVNRMRESLGWDEGDVTRMVGGFARPLGVHFLPDDRPSCDAALAEGLSLVEGRDGPLRRAIAELTSAVFPESVAAAAGRRTSRGARRRRG